MFAYTNRGWIVHGFALARIIAGFQSPMFACLRTNKRSGTNGNAHRSSLNDETLHWRMILRLPLITTCQQNINNTPPVQISAAFTYRALLPSNHDRIHIRACIGHHSNSFSKAFNLVSDRGEASSSCARVFGLAPRTAICAVPAASSAAAQQNLLDGI